MSHYFFITTVGSNPKNTLVDLKLRTPHGQCGWIHITRELLISKVNHLILLTNNPMRVGRPWCYTTNICVCVWMDTGTGPRPIIYKHLLQKNKARTKCRPSFSLLETCLKIQETHT